MGRFVRGDVVVLPFPFSDLSAQKRRPVLVVKELAGVDFIVCPITTKNNPQDPFRISLTSADLETGQLNHASWIRISRLFSADSRLVARSIGRLRPSKLDEVLAALRSLFS